MLVVVLLEKTGAGDLFAAIVFVVASLTDAVDGYLAVGSQQGTVISAARSAS